MNGRAVRPQQTSVSPPAKSRRSALASSAILKDFYFPRIRSFF